MAEVSHDELAISERKGHGPFELSMRAMQWCWPCSHAKHLDDAVQKAHSACIHASLPWIICIMVDISSESCNSVSEEDSKQKQTHEIPNIMGLLHHARATDSAYNCQSTQHRDSDPGLCDNPPITCHRYSGMWDLPIRHRDKTQWR